jgi:hypothetical protein
MAVQTFTLTSSSPEEEAALAAARNDPLIQGIRSRIRNDGKGESPLPGPLEGIRAFFIRLGKKPE